MSKYAKALVGAVIAALSAYGVALDGGVTSQEWGQIAVAFLGGLSLVWAVPNAPAPAEGE